MPERSSLIAALRTTEQMRWIHDRFKIDGLERLSRADRDYADSHGHYLPDVAALAHEALTTLRAIAFEANQLAEDGLMAKGTGCKIRDKALAALGARGDEAIRIIRGDYE